MSDLKKNSLVELTIESVAFGAKGIARINDFVIFVRDALPGQKVKALIIKKKAAFAEAIIREIIEPSLWQIDAPCPYFDDCGGCKFQNLDYQKQLDIKTEQVKDVFTHLAKMPDIPILPALAAPKQYAYRNKMDFSTGVSRWILSKNDPGTAEDFAIGLHAPGRFDRILDIEACLLQDDARNAVFQTIRTWAQTKNITLNNKREYTGYLRSIMIRKGEHSGEIMVNLITRSEDTKLLQPLVDLIRTTHPNVSSIVNNITNSKGDHSFGDKEILLYGSPVIHDTLGGLEYEISANAFFQTNTEGAEQLYDVVVDFAELKSTMVVWDFYSGAGSISLYIADKVKQVIGFEVVRDAVKNAKKNAKRNNVPHCEFFEANLDTFLQSNQEMIASLEKPDLAIVDPPRAGLNPKFVKQLIGLKPPSIVYVSCNPSTQARDIQLLVEGGYEVEKIQPVDMFPHTAHIETVAKLKLNV